MMKGKVKWFDRKKGYGFIQTETGEDVFVHYNDISGDGFKVLNEGEEVQLEVTKGERGMKAVNVSKVEAAQ